MTEAQKAGTGGESDLAILYPEREATIGDRVVVMREYTFAESLKFGAQIAALSDALTGVAMGGELHDLDSIRIAFGEQHNHVQILIAVACDQPLEWVAKLPALDGDSLLMLWWGVNCDFFLMRVLRSVSLLKARELRDLAGPTSTPPSSLSDTIRSDSADTPVAS